MSKKIFSAQDWENVPSEIQQIHTPRIAPIYNKVEDDVESVVREIEQCAIDIAPHYKDCMVGISRCGDMLVALVGFSFSSVRSTQLHRQMRPINKELHFIFFMLICVLEFDIDAEAEGAA